MQKNKIKAITIKGFRSIRNMEEFPLHKELNVLIGANGSGKSNFINFFKMLESMAKKELQNFVATSGGAEALLFRGLETTQEMSASLLFDGNEYAFSLKASEDEGLFFSKEVIHFEGPVYEQASYPQGEGHRETGLLKEKVLSPAEKRALEALQGWRLYHFHNTGSNAPMMQSANRVDNLELYPDASNIAPFLLRIKEENEEYYKRIVSHVRQVAPYFDDFVLNADKNEKVRLLWKEKYGNKIFYPSQLSDGSIRFICLATVLLQPAPPATIIIDEPELGLHPYAITILAGMLRLAAEKSQLIVSTQSSPLVDHLELDDLIIADREKGETLLSRPDPEKMKDWLERYSIGELWDKNLLGGRPCHV